MHLALIAVDHFVKKLGPVNALIEKLCERLLPNEVAYAYLCSPTYECLFDWGCGVTTGSSYAYYCVDFDNGQLHFLHCGC